MPIRKKSVNLSYAPRISSSVTVEILLVFIVDNPGDTNMFDSTQYKNLFSECFNNILSAPWSLLVDLKWQLLL